MEYKNKLVQLLELHRKVNYDYQKYLATPREYYPGEFLHMREVHIVMEIGLDGMDNVSELAEKMGVTQGAVSQQLSKLEKKGFLSRTQLPQDRRQYTLALTEKGKRLYRLHQNFDAENYAKACQMFTQFTPEDLALVTRFELTFDKFICAALQEIGNTKSFPEDEE